MTNEEFSRCIQEAGEKDFTNFQSEIGHGLIGDAARPRRLGGAVLEHGDGVIAQPAGLEI